MKDADDNVCLEFEISNFDRDTQAEAVAKLEKFLDTAIRNPFDRMGLKDGERFRFHGMRGVLIFRVKRDE